MQVDTDECTESRRTSANYVRDRSFIMQPGRLWLETWSHAFSCPGSSMPSLADWVTKRHLWGQGRFALLQYCWVILRGNYPIFGFETPLPVLGVSPLRNTWKGTMKPVTFPILKGQVDMKMCVRLRIGKRKKIEKFKEEEESVHFESNVPLPLVFSSVMSLLTSCKAVKYVTALRDISYCSFSNQM